MKSNPYLSESANVYNEEIHKIEPARFGNQNLLLDHGQHRTIYDRTTTSLANNQQAQMAQNGLFQLIPPPHQQHPQIYQGQMHIIPEGVRYTFHPDVQNYALRNFEQYGQQSQISLQQQQMAANQSNDNALELMLLQERMKQNPFKLQFHRDAQTDTEDLQYACSCYNSKCAQGATSSLISFRMGKEGALTESGKIDINAYNGPQPERLFLDGSKDKLNLSCEDVNEPEPKCRSVTFDCVENSEEKTFSSVYCQTDRKVAFAMMRDYFRKKSRKSRKDVYDWSSDESADSKGSNE